MEQDNKEPTREDRIREGKIRAYVPDPNGGKWMMFISAKATEEVWDKVMELHTSGELTGIDHIQRSFSGMALFKTVHS